MPDFSILTDKQLQNVVGGSSSITAAEQRAVNYLTERANAQFQKWLECHPNASPQEKAMRRNTILQQVYNSLSSTEQSLIDSYIRKS